MFDEDVGLREELAEFLLDTCDVALWWAMNEVTLGDYSTMAKWYTYRIASIKGLSAWLKNGHVYLPDIGPQFEFERVSDAFNEWRRERLRE